MTEAIDGHAYRADTERWHQLYILGRKYAQLEITGQSTTQPLEKAKTIVGNDPFQTVAFNCGRQFEWERST